MTSKPTQDIAVIGSGISGLSCAWLLSRRHRVTLFEAAPHLGGHSRTIMAPGRSGSLPVDIGFIVFNEKTYPNLTAFLAHLDVPTHASSMSFAVSMNDGSFEYRGGKRLDGLFGQRRNLVRARFWHMVRDILRFYREAPRDAARLEDELTPLGAYLDERGYGRAFVQDHLLPMAAAIWSCSTSTMLAYPAASFVRFFANHGLLQVRRRPQWRTVTGGAAAYVRRIQADLGAPALTGVAVTHVERDADGVLVRDAAGQGRRFDQVVLAAHADQALAMLDRPTQQERRLLGAFAYAPNEVHLHQDESLMPRRRRVWGSWNYVSRTAPAHRPSVTYWMNSLQGLPAKEDYFVSLNPERPPARAIHRETFRHPCYDAQAIAAQRALWSLQGTGGVWFCGAYFGAGFHEDGLQSGLAVAEALGGVRRPWEVLEENGRIHVPDLEPGPGLGLPLGAALA